MVLRKWESRSLPPKSRTTASCPALFFIPSPSQNVGSRFGATEPPCSPPSPTPAAPPPRRIPQKQPKSLARWIGIGLIRLIRPIRLMGQIWEMGWHRGGRWGGICLAAVSKVARSHHGATLHCGGGVASRWEVGWHLPGGGGQGGES